MTTKEEVKTCNICKGNTFIFWENWDIQCSGCGEIYTLTETAITNHALNIVIGERNRGK